VGVRCWALGDASRKLYSPTYDHEPCTVLSQADSLVDLLNNLHRVGTIKLTRDPSIQPHGISCIDVLDPDAFRR
jgi:hypothetical protein